jgi:FkbM family methyltransferase
MMQILPTCPETFFADIIMNLPAYYTDGIAIDIGSHIGFYSLMLVKKFETVYAFEPNPIIFNTVSSFGEVPNLTRYQKAIGPIDGQIKIYIGPNSSTATINPDMEMVTLEDGKVTTYTDEHVADVDSVMLDTVCRGKKVAFIKCDIEGGEELIFDPECAEQTLSTNQVMIALETHKGANMNKLTRNLRRYGFDQFLSEDYTLVDHLDHSKHYLISRKADFVLKPAFHLAPRDDTYEFYKRLQGTPVGKSCSDWFNYDYYIVDHYNPIM